MSLCALLSGWAGVAAADAVHEGANASPFELHRGYVVVGLIVFTAQLGLIVGLLVHRERRRRAEEASRASEARYRSVVDTQSDLICRFQPDSTLTFVNDAYCRFWNRTRDELLGSRFVDLIPAATRQVVLERVGRLRGGMDSHEHPVILADGSIGWQHWINQAIVDGRGHVVELQGVGRDITDRKRAEEAIIQLEARNSAILRAIPDQMFMLLRDGTYVDYHARDPKLLFVPPEQFLGRTIREIMPADVADALMDALERACLADDAADPVVVEYELATSEPHSFEARMVRAGPERVLSIVRDVTDAKRTLELNRALAGRLITSQEAERTRIARDLHDGVGQDVAAIAVEVSHLRQQHGDIQGRTGPIHDLLVSLERKTARVAESLRLLSHGLHPAVLHHVGLVAAVHAHCAEVERQHRVQVRLFVAGDVEPTSQLVTLSLFRIAQEALRNAVRHGHARNATVSLTQVGTDVALAVTDDGAGFDLAAGRRNGGLGLASIEERTRLVHGHLRIRTRPGQGTIIDVRVPVDGVDPRQTRLRETAGAVARRATTTPVDYH